MEESKRTPTELFLENEKLIPFVLHKRGIYAYALNVREEFEGECRVTLWKCALSYEENTGYAFSTFTVAALHNTISQGLKKFYKKNVLDIPLSALVPELRGGYKSELENTYMVDNILSYPSNIDTEVDTLACRELVYAAIDHSIGTLRNSLQGFTVEELREILVEYYVEELKVQQIGELHHVAARKITVTIAQIQERIRDYVSKALRENKGEQQSGNTNSKRSTRRVVS